MGKRANGTGSIIWLEKKQLWEFRVTIQDADGVSDRRAVYGKTQKEAIDKAKKLEEQARKGLLAKKDGRTFKEFAHDWLERKIQSGRAQATIRGYKEDLGLAYTHIGDMRLQTIRPGHIRRLIDYLAREEYATRTQRHTLQTVKAVFAQALRLELIYKNPAEHIEVEASSNESKGRSLQPEEVQALLEAVRETPMGLFFRLLIGCGIRKGEALALTWGDINLGKGEMSISKNWTGSGYLSTPKTKSSRRVVPIPSGLLARLEAEYKKLLKDWTPQELKSIYVFGLDRPYGTQAPNHTLKRLIERINKKRKEDAAKAEVSAVLFPEIRVHDLRHTYGSIALSKGIPLEVVSERMGHANPTITLNVYRHVLEHERRGYVFDVEEMIGSHSKVHAQA